MSKTHWLIIVVIVILATGGLFWYLNYGFRGGRQISEQPEQPEQQQGAKSIPLEKPPFLKE